MTGQYPQDLVDVIFQPAPGRQPTLVDAFYFAQFLRALDQSQILGGALEVEAPPARRGDVAENQQRVSAVHPSRDGLFVDLVTGSSTQFKALYYGALGSRGIGDGMLMWDAPITLASMNTASGDKASRELPPGQCVLLAGTVPITVMRVLLVGNRIVARWPKGQARITLLAKAHPDLTRRDEATSAGR